ncbi:redoxin domain-containing protein [Rhodobacteraceae bacterium B1Z28]|uniref:Redoxin domain-containing protein n=1 Tax=Ruegeria haliotis TaxID=2747601 RepID=A0ABX2PZL1_9RHOB|nr:redoxin domain-containing protein [Ruegeria haliotis]NVO58517.1 redoxin domain-containing protein [Ruegeria haliotis]
MTHPELQVSQWFNTTNDISLKGLAGKVIALEVFQMLCPGCVRHGLPLAQKIATTFPQEKVAVLGLHSVFEHHNAMTPVSLQAFLHEYQIDFPVGVDEAGKGNIPKTMEAFQLRGTPSLLLFDTAGRLRAHHLGNLSELALGAEIATLLSEGAANETQAEGMGARSECNAEGCMI